MGSLSKANTNQQPSQPRTKNKNAKSSGNYLQAYNSVRTSQILVGTQMNAIAESKLRTVMSWVATVLVGCMAAVFFGIICLRGVEEKAWVKVTQDHFAAIVGLPAAAVAALFLVLVLRMADGPIEVELGPIKFKGAAAPIVFWLLCFLAMALAIKMVWGA